MKIFGLLLLPLLFAGCLGQECRQCDAFTFDVERINPDYGGTNLRFVDPVTGDELTFERIQSIASPAQERCVADVDSSDDIDCATAATISYRNQDMGTDMLFVAERLDVANAGREDQTIFYYEFKAMERTQFVRTHAVIVEPEIELNDDIVRRLDTITLGNRTYEDVLDLLQPASFLETIGEAIPARAKFTNLYLLEGFGLVGLRNVDGEVFVREF